MPRRPGFSVLELMLAVAIIATILAILLPNVIKPRGQAKYQACIQNLNALASNLEVYKVEAGFYPDSLSQVLKQAYGLESLPTCPSAGFATYQYSSNNYLFTLWCSGKHHVDVEGVEENYPQYSSDAGGIR